MNAFVLSFCVFAMTLAALALGVSVAKRVPQHHLIADARHTAHVGIGMLATLLALVLGLTITSAKHAFDERNEEISRVASNMLLMDRALAGFGSEAQPARLHLQALFSQVQAHVAPDADKVTPALLSDLDALELLMRLQHAILKLEPGTPAQTWYQQRAMQLSTHLAQDRVVQVERGGSSVPAVLLVIVAAWVVMIYLGLGLFGINNTTVQVTLAVCALAFACALFVVIELDSAYTGVVGVSLEPLARVGQVMGR